MHSKRSLFWLEGRPPPEENEFRVTLYSVKDLYTLPALHSTSRACHSCTLQRPDLAQSQSPDLDLQVNRGKWVPVCGSPVPAGNSAVLPAGTYGSLICLKFFSWNDESLRIRTLCQGSSSDLRSRSVVSSCGRTTCRAVTR